MVGHKKIVFFSTNFDKIRTQNIIGSLVATRVHYYASIDWSRALYIYYKYAFNHMFLIVIVPIAIV